MSPPALLARGDDIALYEHGTFAPVLTPELSERMVRNPRHFEVKHFANTTGARLEVVEALAKGLGVRPGFRRLRVENVLGVVGQLITQVRRLDNFARRTRGLSAETVKAREALFAAVEPDELLFQSLPEAYALPAVSASAKQYPGADDYAEKLAQSMEELANCLGQLLSQLLQDLFQASAETSRHAISGQAKALEGEVLAPGVRAFVLTLANDTVDSDADWIGAIATVVEGKAPPEWTDADLARFRPALSHQVDAFQRLVALHADRHADGGGPFKPFRLTLTRPDGNEHVGLIGVDDKDHHFVSEILDRGMEELIGRMGSEKRALSALMAMIAEKFLPSQEIADEETATEFYAGRERDA